ncbi:hypothetical protein MKX01_016823 [Papaver californicum]|nr:hypothetical protein MKX01_016823 [Papaver californicum]
MMQLSQLALLYSQQPLFTKYFFVKMCAGCHLAGTLCMWTDCTTCFEGSASTAGECGCLAGAGEAGLPLLCIMANSELQLIFPLYHVILMDIINLCFLVTGLCANYF